MTILHGDVTKVHEVLKKGYSEPIVQTTNGYTITTGPLAAATFTYDLPNISTGKTGYVNKISVTCDDNTALHTIYLTRISDVGTVWNFFTSYFYIGDEWDTGNVAIGDTASWTVTIINLAAGTNFTINVYWMES